MGVLEDRFGVPPFSILDSKQKYWIDRKKEWLSIGIESEIGREAKSINTQSWVKDKKLSGFAGNFSGVSIFDPVLTELMYKWFCVPRGKILDPFAGGSVRGIVASVFGYDYTGVDLRKEQVEANFENIPKLSINLPIKPNWICNDSINIDKINNSFDMIFSCPPYHDLEKYSKDPRDISNMDYDDFVQKYTEIIKNSCSRLKDNSFAVFVVGEIRDKDGIYKNFVGDTINAFIKAGLLYYNEIIKIDSIGSLPMRVSKQFESYRKIGKLHQNILVFFKGNTRECKKMGDNKFTPLNEINIDMITRDTTPNIQTEEEKSVEKPKENTIETTICEICGVDYRGSTKEEHEQRPFHQNALDVE
jgi:16S rRNA G966 N2-methylase RsmD